MESKKVYVKTPDMINGMFNGNVGVNIDIKIYDALTHEVVKTMKFDDFFQNEFLKVFHK